MFLSRRTRPEAMAGAPPLPMGLPARDVLILADWQEVPQALSFPGSGLKTQLAQCPTAAEALALVLERGIDLDAVVVETDVFGAPEEAADFCFSLRRLAPWVWILALESELWEDEGMLQVLGACDFFLPRQAGPLRIHEVLIQNAPAS
ncbi:hypothetical protein [Pseudooceanicola sp. 200-1SW]|uniref:hypothetical protein n=1 Tax=Pseudooceanicola sp. 200-1SW TaxID=3425949 RepID=UPI003D7F87A9